MGPMMNSQLSPQQTPRSKYGGVYYKRERNAWRAQIRHDQKALHIGYYETEREAAAAVNEKCTELGIPIKNPDISSNTPIVRRKRRIRRPNVPKSKFRYVYWDSKTQKWRAQMVHNGKTYSLGTYVNEEDAAHAINRKCLELRVSVKNKTLDPNTMPPVQQKKRKGKYTCVYWSEEKGKWLGQFMHKKKRTFIGYFNTELEAAQAVNEKCVSLGIKLKNPEIAQQVRSEENQETTESQGQIDEGFEEDKHSQQNTAITNSDTETTSSVGSDSLERRSSENRLRIFEKDKQVEEQKKRVEEQKRVLAEQEEELRRLRQNLANQRLYIEILKKQQQEKEDREKKE